MPDFDIDTPSPDDGHEAIRLAVVQAIADLEANTLGVDDAYFLSDLLFDLLGTALVDLAQARADLEALTARVAALEPAVFTTEEPPSAN